MVVCLRSCSGAGWSAINISVSTSRLRCTSGVAVCTSMPSSHGRTHAAANARPPVSTTHIRHTPTGS